MQKSIFCVVQLFTSAHDHQEVSVTRLSFGMTSKVHLVISHPKKCRLHSCPPKSKVPKSSAKAAKAYNQARRRGAPAPSCLSVAGAEGAQVPFLNAVICFLIVNMIQRRSYKQAIFDRKDNHHSFDCERHST